MYELWSTLGGYLLILGLQNTKNNTYLRWGFKYMNRTYFGASRIQARPTLGLQVYYNRTDSRASNRQIIPTVGLQVKQRLCGASGQVTTFNYQSHLVVRFALFLDGALQPRLVQDWGSPSPKEFVGALSDLVREATSSSHPSC